MAFHRWLGVGGHHERSWAGLNNSKIFLFISFPEQAPEQRVMENYGAEEEEETLEFLVLGL